MNVSKRFICGVKVYAKNKCTIVSAIILTIRDKNHLIHKVPPNAQSGPKTYAWILFCIEIILIKTTRRSVNGV